MDGSLTLGRAEYSGGENSPPLPEVVFNRDPALQYETPGRATYFAEADKPQYPEIHVIFNSPGLGSH